MQPVILETLAIINLGCSKNLVDGERMVAFCREAGCLLTEEYDRATIIIVNTCTFIREATSEAIQSVLEMAKYKKTGLCKKLIVAGCFSQRYRETVQEQLPEVDHWIGVSAWERELAEVLNIPPVASFRRVLSEPIATQYLKIAEGCSYRCSFCIIPSIKGPFESRIAETILDEALWLQENGVKECILVAQDTSLYGRDKGTTLVALLEMLLSRTTFPWIRMMYLHPHSISKDFLKLVGSEKRICSYLDIPLQHIADPILLAMYRTPHTEREVRVLIETIRHYIPDATIRTSFILGFPGETNAHLQKLLTFMEWAKFDKVGVFPFSPEEGTPAYGLKRRAKNETVEKRCALVMDLQREISRELLEKKVGSKQEIIIDRVCDDPDFAYEGRTRCDAPEIDGRVFVINSSEQSNVGEIVSATIVNAGDYDLFATINE